MNWYKKSKLNKQATINFWVEGTNKISQPMNKNDISNDLSKFIFQDMGLGEKLNMQWDDVDPDMSSGDMSDMTGTINMYLTNPYIKEGIVKNIIDKYNEFKSGSIKLKFLTINKSGLSFRKNVNVARILIEENNTINQQTIPEMNISNINANALIQLLQNEGHLSLNPYGGILKIDELQNAINNIENNEYILNTYTKEPTTDKNDKLIVYEGGTSKEQLIKYINKLKEMIYYINNNNLPNRQINYG